MLNSDGLESEDAARDEPSGPINVMVQPDNFWNNSKPKTEQDSVKPSQGQTLPPHSHFISGLLLVKKL